MRSSFKGILKYLIYIFIAGWMFLLGIVVGRGTSPVKFDTQKFQERLESIAKERGKEKGHDSKKINLEFFGALNHPIPTEGMPSLKKPKEIIPKKEDQASVAKEGVKEGVKEGIPVKTSLKKITFNNQDPKSDSGNGVKQNFKESKAPDPVPVPGPAVPKIIPPKKVATAKSVDATAKPVDMAAQKVNEKGIYTIQIAAYKNVKDAVTQMAQLEKKGFTSYRVKTIIKGETWYRIRTGSFLTFAQAKLFIEKLKQARVKAMIIKKEQP
ncbi:MAG: SPOR domain-containing protein [Pseudomonadota bacterium]